MVTAPPMSSLVRRPLARLTLYSAQQSLAQLTLSNLNGKNGFWFPTDSNSLAAAGAGDINQDGFGDVLIGPPEKALFYNRGSTYLIYGKTR
jgi:hypothetical protein